MSQRELAFAGITIAAASGLLALASAFHADGTWALPLGAGYVAFGIVLLLQRLPQRGAELVLAAAALLSWSSAAAAGVLPASAVPAGYLVVLLLCSRWADSALTALLAVACLGGHLLVRALGDGALDPWELGWESGALLLGAVLLLSPAWAAEAEPRRDLLASWARSDAATAPLEGERGSAERIGHELRNLLTAAACHVELLGREPGPDERSSGARIVCDALREAMSLSQRLLPADPPGSAGPPARLNEEVERAIRLLEPVLPSEVRIRLQLDPQVSEVPLDAEQVQEVVRNLVLNAAEAIEGPGSIQVETRAATEAERRQVWLEVCDDGCGMDPATLAAACEPHFTTKEKGCGLGLAGVRERVESAGGRLQIASAPGRGTRVAVQLLDAPAAAGLADVV